MPILTDIIAALPAAVPFVGPEAIERRRGRQFLARIGANENVFGPSPNAIDAMRRATAGVWQYGDPENSDLRHALAEFYRIEAENIVVGEGIDGLLGYLVGMTVSAGNKVVTSDGAYPTFNYHVRRFGGELIKLPNCGEFEDIDALIAVARQQRAKLIYLANPDNPMGTFHGREAVSRMIDAVPEGCLLILDEAYLECTGLETAPEVDPLDRRVIRMRTFSKAYGMAGARVGYAIGHRDWIAAFEKVRNHFGMCRISQAGALAALQDQSYLRQTVAAIADARRRIGQISCANGLRTIPSSANFVAIDCGGDGGFARHVLDGLLARDIFARMPNVSPLDRCIRISAGTAKDLEYFAEALPPALQEATSIIPR